MHVEEDAGHAFHNRKAPMFYVPEPAARAWRRAEEFLQRHLPVRAGQRGQQLIADMRGGDPGDLGVIVGGRDLHDVGADEVQPGE